MALSLSIAATLTLVVVNGVFVAAEFEGRGHMGIVRDRDDQKTLGIVTLEDVLESLVGHVREAPAGGSPPC